VRRDAARRVPALKGLDKRLFDQIIDPTNLALLGSERHRTLILLLAHSGLRVSSLVLLRRDALQEGSDGHPYLRFDNVKLSREAVMELTRSRGHLTAWACGPGQEGCPDATNPSAVSTGVPSRGGGARSVRDAA